MTQVGHDSASEEKVRLGKTLILTHPARMGDTLMALPLHRAAARHGELESNVGEPFRFLLEMSGVAARQSGALYPKGARALLTEARALRQRSFETVFLVRPNFRSALLAYLARIPIRVGDRTEGRGILLNRPVDVPQKANQIDRLRLFGERVGLSVPAEFGLPADPKRSVSTIGVAPGASYSDKVIPAKVLREVCERLLADGHQLVWLGGPGEEPYAEPLRDLPAEDWIAKYSLPDLVRPLGSLTAVLAADGGLYHLSVACGVPSVGVYGPTTNRYWWHRWGPHMPVLAPEGKIELVQSEAVWTALQQALGQPKEAGVEVIARPSPVPSA